jgi:hypothetical protein
MSEHCSCLLPSYHHGNTFTGRKVLGAWCQKKEKRLTFNDDFFPLCHSIQTWEAGETFKQGFNSAL